MFMTMLILAIPSCFIEYKLTAKRPKVRLFFSQHKVAAVIFSTVISAIFGAVFGADGLYVFGAGMISTMIMVCVYAVQPTIEENKEGFQLAGGMISMLFKGIIFLIMLPFKTIAFIANMFFGE